MANSHKHTRILSLSFTHKLTQKRLPTNSPPPHTHIHSFFRTNLYQSHMHNTHSLTSLTKCKRKLDLVNIFLVTCYKKRAIQSKSRQCWVWPGVEKIHLKFWHQVWWVELEPQFCGNFFSNSFSCALAPLFITQELCQLFHCCTSSCHPSQSEEVEIS